MSAEHDPPPPIENTNDSFAPSEEVFGIEDVVGSHADGPNNDLLFEELNRRDLFLPPSYVLPRRSHTQTTRIAMVELAASSLSNNSEKDESGYWQVDPRSRWIGQLLRNDGLCNMDMVYEALKQGNAALTGPFPEPSPIAAEFASLLCDARDSMPQVSRKEIAGALSSALRARLHYPEKDTQSQLEDQARVLNKKIVGQIIELRHIPSEKGLPRLVQVDVAPRGKEPHILQVMCGGDDVLVRGHKVPVALPGARLLRSDGSIRSLRPRNFNITDHKGNTTRIRSKAMLCSRYEAGIGNDTGDFARHQVALLPQDTPTGLRFSRFIRGEARALMPQFDPNYENMILKAIASHKKLDFLYPEHTLPKRA